MKVCVWLLEGGNVLEANPYLVFAIPENQTIWDFSIQSFPATLQRRRQPSRCILGPNKSQKVKKREQFVSLRWELVTLNDQHMQCCSVFIMRRGAGNDEKPQESCWVASLSQDASVLIPCAGALPDSAASLGGGFCEGEARASNLEREQTPFAPVRPWRRPPCPRNAGDEPTCDCHETSSRLALEWPSTGTLLKHIWALFWQSKQAQSPPEACWKWGRFYSVPTQQNPRRPDSGLMCPWKWKPSS